MISYIRKKIVVYSMYMYVVHVHTPKETRPNKTFYLYDCMNVTKACPGPATLRFLRFLRAINTLALYQS